jgi:hypothetical protein
MTVEQFNKVIELIQEGDSLRKACKKLNYSSTSTFFKFIEGNDLLIEQYTRAREERAEKIFEEILDIADHTANDTITKRFGETEVEVENHEWVNRSKLRIDARKWMLGKMQPKKYGDKLDLTSDGEKLSQDTSIVVNIVQPNQDE